MPMKAEKRELRVIVYTERHKIEGIYHMVPDARFSDDLNARQKDFIPLTRVRITDVHDSGNPSMESDFLALNKHHIVMFFVQSPEH